MTRNAKSSIRWVLLVSLLAAVAFSASPGSAAQGGSPFAPGSRVEGSHADALLILHNLGTGASLRLNSEGGGPGLRSESKSGDGVIATTNSKDRFAVLAYSTAGVGVKGQSDNNDGVVGWTGSKGTAGVWGNSTLGVGVRGDSSSNDGVRGFSSTGVGVSGRSDKNDGVVGWTGLKDKSGVWGHSTAGIGVTGTSDTIGVQGVSTSGTGVLARSEQGTALYVDGTSIFDGYANFEGGHGDLAENYLAGEPLEAGDVVAIDPAGGLALVRSRRPNDTGVAGIISTDPSMKLQGLIDDSQGVPLVLAGRTPCKVDASFGAIWPGDLLTSSATPGHAMKARPVVIGGVELYLPGTIIGKALQTLQAGRGVIMVLVTLQ